MPGESSAVSDFPTPLSELYLTPVHDCGALEAWVCGVSLVMMT